MLIGVEDLCTEGGNLTSNDQAKAGVSNHFFCSVCICEDPIRHPSSGTKTSHFYDGQSVDDMGDRVDLVRKKLPQLKVSSAAGPEEIPRVCETADTHLFPFALPPYSGNLRCFSRSTGSSPNVVSIYKKGQKDNSKNYSSVSQTSVPGPVL